MLHRHVEALLQHRIVSLDVGSRPNITLSSCTQLVTIIAILESSFTGIKHHPPSQIFIARHRPWLPSDLQVVIIPRSWVFRYQMTKERLRSLLPWSCGIESYISTAIDCIFLGSGLLGPVFFERIIDSNIWGSTVSYISYVLIFCLCLKRDWFDLNS